MIIAGYDQHASCFTCRVYMFIDAQLHKGHMTKCIMLIYVSRLWIRLEVVEILLLYYK